MENQIASAHRTGPGHPVSDVIAPNIAILPQGATSSRRFVMRNTKLIVSMLAGCMAISGAVMAQNASQSSSPTPASNAGSQTQTTDSKGTDSNSMNHGSMNSGSNGSMNSGSNGSMNSGTSGSMNSGTNGSMNSGTTGSDANGSMKSTHKKHKKASTTTSPTSSSSSGM